MGITSSQQILFECDIMSEIGTSFDCALFPNNPLGVIHQIPFLSAKRCDEIVRLACSSTRWTTRRHKNFPTNDIPINNIENLDLSDELKQILCLCMKSYNLNGKIDLFDTFVVQYKTDGQDCLDVHRDSSELSFILALSDPCDFTGGGTFYESHAKTVVPNKGDILFHCGKLRHGGKKITSGSRYILIGFFSVDSSPVRKASETIPNNISDRRYLDYLHRHNTLQNVKIYVKIINLIGRKEKLQKIYQRVQKLDVPDGWKVDTQVVIANEGNNHHGYKGWKTNETFGCGQHITKYWNRDVTKGEVGCTLSHLQAIESVGLGDNEYLLVLEDDADFYSDLLFRIDHCLQGDVQWDMLDLGGICVSGKTEPISFYQYRNVGYTYQTHSILYNRHALKKLQGIDITERIVAYDEMLALLMKKSGRLDLKKLYSDIDTLFAIYPYERMCHQSGSVHDTEQNASHINMFSRVKDDYDMINFYKFSNVNLDNKDALIDTANRKMWNFDINSVIEGTVRQAWNIHITASIKLVAVFLKSEESSLTFQHNDRMLSKHKDFIIFPSYLSVKILGCDVWFACGSAFY